jgi:hypothetical protein
LHSKTAIEGSRYCWDAALKSSVLIFTVPDSTPSSMITASGIIFVRVPVFDSIGPLLSRGLVLIEFVVRSEKIVGFDV